MLKASPFDQKGGTSVFEKFVKAWSSTASDLARGQIANGLPNPCEFHYFPIFGSLRRVAFGDD